MKLSMGLRIGSGLIGAISLLTLVSLHPINIAFAGVAVALYFASNWFEKAGQ